MENILIKSMVLAVLINNRDRPTELALLLQSLRTQTYQDFDVFILDDCSGTLLNNYHFLSMMIVRMRQENHNVFVKRTDFNLGVSKARQEIVDMAMKGEYELFLRVDDDCILEQDYIERLVKVIDTGYDIASGVTIPFTPQIIREPSIIQRVNRVVLDKDGNFIFNGDDCGIGYTESKVIEADHFRSCALMKRKVHEKVRYSPTRLSKNGFREEEIFSFNALIEGFRIAVDTGATNYHLLTPSGGERDTMNMCGFNEMVLKDFVKENKDKLPKYFFGEIDKEVCMKETNCIR